MRTLFSKIFIWYCLAIVVAMATFFLSALIFPSDSPFSRAQEEVQNTLTLSGYLAIDKYYQLGKKGVTQLYSELSEKSDRRIFLFTGEGILIGEASPPQGTSKVISRAKISDKLIIDWFRQKPLAAKRIQSKKGHTFVIMGKMPKGRLQILFGISTSQLIRIMIVFTVSGIVCYFLAWYISTPVRRLQETINKFADGDLTARVGIGCGRRKDELINLGYRFDKMAERIQQLVDARGLLMRDISHELRSPLARLNVALDLARVGTDFESEFYLNRIAHEADRMNKMISDILIFSRIEGDSQNATIERVDIGSLIKEIEKDAQFEARTGNCSVLFSPDVKILLNADHELLRSAIENIVRNGLRHTAEGTTVEINLADKWEGGKRYAIIKIRDHGPGVAETDLDNLFDPFIRAKSSCGEQAWGTGIGLSIAWEATQVHNGKIEALNAAGGGLVVELTLPI